MDCATCGNPGYWCEERGEPRCRYHWPTAAGPPSREIPRYPVGPPWPASIPPPLHPELTALLELQLKALRRRRAREMIPPLIIVLAMVLAVLLMLFMLSLR